MRLGSKRLLSPKSSEIKKVIFIHSRKHFDPINDFSNRKLYGTGMANFGRNTWKLFDNTERFYIDGDEDITSVPTADLVIGLFSRNFAICAKANPQAKKILIMHGSHPLYREATLLAEAFSLDRHIPSSRHLFMYFYNARPLVNSIIVTGNGFTKRTYIINGVVEIPVFPIDIAVNQSLLPALEQRSKNIIRFTFSSSSMDIRKGFIRMMRAWEKLNDLIGYDKTELLLIGSIDPYFADDAEVFIRKNRNVRSVGWVSDDDLKKYLQSSHVVVAPSLEEGQVSSVLEAMACGAVPIVTPQCGINIENGIDGFIIHDYKNADEIAQSMKALAEDSIMRECMSVAAIRNIKTFHKPEQYRQNLRRFIEQS
jgi:glycosyltransferase involved in cell wall biosynthesis